MLTLSKPGLLSSLAVCCRRVYGEFFQSGRRELHDVLSLASIADMLLMEICVGSQQSGNPMRER